MANDNEPRALRAALWYARERGWAVLPVVWPTEDDGKTVCSCGKKDCGSIGKHPLSKSGVKDASKDEATIRGWFDKWPEANIGIATGIVSGIWVVDVDPRHEGDETMRDLEKAHGKLPFTPYCITGSKGAHYFFRIPTDVVVASRANVAPGIDVRGEGGYVVAAPSLHASGNRYEWELDSRPEAVLANAAPSWLLDLAVGRGPAKAPGKDASGANVKPPAAALPDQIREGGRDNAMTSFAGTMRRRGASAEAILAALRVENSQKCVPPLSESDLQRIAWSVAKKEPGDPVDGSTDQMPLEDRATIGQQVMKELQTKDADALIAALEDRNIITALAAVRRVEPGMFAAGMERVRPVSIRKRFESVVKEAVKQATRRKAVVSEDPRPEINLSNGDIEEHTSQAITHLVEATRPPAPRALYLRSGRIVRVRNDEEGAAIVELCEKAMVEALGFAIHFASRRTGPDGVVETRDEYPPVPVANSILKRPDLELPRLSTLYTHPVLVDADGSPLPLLDGYHAASGVLVANPGGIAPALPLTATPEEARAAAKWMFDEVFADFPFEGPAEVATAYAIAFAPFLRPAIDGNLPLHLVEASSPGSGKGLLVSAALAFATGGHGISFCSPPVTEEEWKKSITANLSVGSEVIVIDNAVGHLDSASLSAALTSPVWVDRRFGRNDVLVRLPSKAIWVLIGNNASLSNDLSRRSLRCRLVPDQEAPYRTEGRKFKHANLTGWCSEHRQEMLLKAWTAIVGWIAAGSPRSTKTFASAEDWAATIGGLLEFLGITGFTDNRSETVEAADRDGSSMREFVNLWFMNHREEPVGTDNLVADALKTEIGLRGNDEASRRRSLSWILRANRDKIFGGWRIVRGKEDFHGRTFWRIVPVTETAKKKSAEAPPLPPPTWNEDDKEPTF